jgi:hypothetical protein
MHMSREFHIIGSVIGVSKWTEILSAGTTTTTTTTWLNISSRMKQIVNDMLPSGLLEKTGSVE